MHMIVKKLNKLLLIVHSRDLEWPSAGLQMIIYIKRIRYKKILWKKDDGFEMLK